MVHTHTEVDSRGQKYFRNAGQQLKTTKEEIIEEWEKAVRSEIPPARKQERSVLRNSLPDFLDALGDAISTGEENAIESCLKISKKHAKERASNPLYTINQVLLEYHHLRKTIIQLLDTSEEERRHIHDFIDFAIAEAGVEFHRLSIEKEQIERRRAEEAIENLRKEKELRENFTLALSHDLRTPLTAAKMSVNILSKKEKDPANQKLCVRVEDNIERVDRMVQDVLDSHRLQAGQRIPLEISKTVLRDIVTTVVENLISIHGARFIVSGTNGEGFWDKRYLARAVENLLTNAVKYGYQGKPIRVTISETNESVSLSVYNEGDPIPKECQSKLFQQFWRVETQTTQKRGWGIGLTLVRGVIEAHGGKIEVKSPIENGTEFKFTLPRDSRNLKF